ncbi:hypothetical protein BDN70DRAFT_991193 [Pholiota conissans]|uniref:HNH nuclease domain-containing protein n=1 Tax=Pholiota conissans TaxID=109636 RepID=A0A9P6CW13_9AGAR|nr:hypothetical protein BDN70DRAFT_991193 [Pholiota conissans]
MSHIHNFSVNSTCTILSCSYKEFSDIFDKTVYTTDELVRKVLEDIISPHRDYLRAATANYRLDELLSSMLEFAPDPLGRRYVAVALLIAGKNGVDAVVEIGNAWMKYLFLPMLVMYKTDKVPSSNETPTLDDIPANIDNASQPSQRTLTAEVSTREEHRCAITRSIDRNYVHELDKKGLAEELPNVPRTFMEVAHIIPCALSPSDEFFSNGPNSKAADNARDMFLSWTHIDVQKLAGSNINLPTNAIYMTINEHVFFRQFVFYLDEEAYPDNPNKYKARVANERLDTFSNGSKSSTVEFRSLEECGIDPPDPEFIKIHAAFAKVVHLSGAAEYLERLEEEAEANEDLFLEDKIDFSACLASKLSAIAF